MRPKAASADGGTAAGAGKARRCFTRSPAAARFNAAPEEPAPARHAPSGDRFGRSLLSRFVGEGSKRALASLGAKPVADAVAQVRERGRERAPLKKRVRVLDGPVPPSLPPLRLSPLPPSLVHLCGRPSVRPRAARARLLSLSMAEGGGNQTDSGAAPVQRTYLVGRSVAWLASFFPKSLGFL